MSRSTKSAGKTAVAHARAWVESIHPGSAVLDANKVSKRFPGGKDARGETIWINRTVEEDLFGVFDLAVFPRDAGVQFVQVTTVSVSAGLSNVRTRQTKVGNWARHQYGGKPPFWLGGVWVVGWVPRKHLRIWSWDWEEAWWDEQEPDPAKLSKRVPSSAASGGEISPASEIPF